MLLSFIFFISYNFFNITHLLSLLLFLFLIFTFSQTFLLPLPLHLPTTLYFNIIFHLSLYLPLFCLFLFSLSYYKFVIFSFILCIVFSNKKVFSLSLSLNVLVDFYFLLHLCFRLINFCVFRNSNLGWYNLVLCFKLLLLLFRPLIVKFDLITL